jgi:hypothetical protein
MNRTDTLASSPDLIAASQRQPKPSALHQPFSWLAPHCEHDEGAQFIGLTLDICQGLQVCLDLVHSDDMIRSINADADPGEEVPHTLSSGEVQQLLRMAKGVAGLLAEEAEKRIRWMNGRT